MKKIHIVAIAMILVGVVVMVFMTKDMAQFASFEQAKVQPKESFKINGDLVKEKPMVYDPLKDANHFSFYMKDRAKGGVEQVVFRGAKPQDFERSEEIVLTGHYGDDGAFYATDMLMKCPSKYKNEEIFVKGNS